MSLKQMQALDMNCKHDWLFINGITKRLRCCKCGYLSFNLGLLDAEEEEFKRIERESTGWRKRQIETLEDGFEAARKNYEFNRDLVLEEVAQEFEKMTAFGDTASSFASFVRGMKK